LSFHQCQVIHSQVMMCLINLNDLTADESKPAVLAMKAIFLQNVGEFFLEHSVYENSKDSIGMYLYLAVDALGQAVDIFWPNISNASLFNPYQRVQCALSLGRLLCLYPLPDELSDPKRGLFLLEEAVRLQEQLLFAEQQPKEDHFLYLTSLALGALCERKQNSLDGNGDHYVHKIMELKTKYCIVEDRRGDEELDGDVGVRLRRHIDNSLNDLQSSSLKLGPTKSHRKKRVIRARKSSSP